MNFHSVFYVIGLLITTLGIAMWLPALLDLFLHNGLWQEFALSGAISVIIGCGMTLAFRQKKISFGNRETFILTSFSWIVLCAFAALPLWAAVPYLSYTDSFFEATSGLTTTGSTIFTDLDNTPYSILLWRSLLQWLGGIGIIVMAIAILPTLKIGGMQLFSSERNEITDGVRPRAARLATSIALIYLLLTITWTLLLWLAGLSIFDSICHAMTTIATGGFSTHNNSIGFYSDLSVEIIILIGMLLASLPFALYLNTITGNKKSLINDSQVRFFLSVVFVSVLFLTLWNYLKNDNTFFEALRISAFNSVSIITGTGYATSNFSEWGTFPTALLFILMFIGGCTGSTTGGLKIFRIQVIISLILSNLKRSISPHIVATPTYDGKPLNDPIINSVIVLLFFYTSAVVIITTLLMFSNLNILTSLSAAATTVAIVGPGLGPIIGPAETFFNLPQHVKWILSFAMILGRLEFLTILVLFMPRFWNR